METNIIGIVGYILYYFDKSYSIEKNVRISEKQKKYLISLEYIEYKSESHMRAALLNMSLDEYVIEVIQSQTRHYVPILFPKDKEL